MAKKTVKFKVTPKSKAEELMQMVGAAMISKPEVMIPNGYENEIEEFGRWCKEKAAKMEDGPAKWLMLESKPVMMFLVGNDFFPGNVDAAMFFLLSIVDETYGGDL